MIDPQLSEAIKGYESSLLPFALRLAGRNGAEVDDLMQEGRLSLWGPLVTGEVPSLEIAFLRMKMWIRYLAAKNPFAYEDIPIMDRFVSGDKWRFDG